MIELMNGLPDNVIGIVGDVNISPKDYSTILMPALEDKRRRHNKIRLLYKLDKEYTRDELTTFFEGEMCKSHANSFEKVALVSDICWLKGAVMLYKFLVPFSMKTFNSNEINKAKEWIGK
jgi:hypothetical protein